MFRLGSGHAAAATSSCIRVDLLVNVDRMVDFDGMVVVDVMVDT